MKVTRAQGPQVPAAYEPADVIAIQALINGKADGPQQQRAMRWIIEQAAGMYEFQYYPSDRDTSFALGRGFVGQQIVKLSKLNATKLLRSGNED